MSNTVLKKYKEIHQKHSYKYSVLSKKSNVIALFRFLTILVFIGSVYKYLQTTNTVYVYTAIGFLFLFFALLKYHFKIGFKKKVQKALMLINAEEISYIEKRELPFKNGNDFKEIEHPYAIDLDIFGEDSLYQNINRTATYIGSKKLAKRLLNTLPDDKIITHQKAIKELSEKINWRQKYKALAMISKDSKQSYQNLKEWLGKDEKPISNIVLFLSYLLPFLLVVSIVLQVFFNVSYTMSIVIFILNLVLVSMQSKRIKQEITISDAIDETIGHYGLMLQQIEQHKFESKKLKELQTKLTEKSVKASEEFKKLSRLFSGMETFLNLFASPLFNGMFAYHIHLLHALIKWKKSNRKNIQQWLEVMGEFEVLNSFANFSYNNPNFTFPKVVNNYELSFINVGHPLLNESKRICNDITLLNNHFRILTGSNMSGKSTFLRTLGINMVLFKSGAPICATKASIHPLPIWVSMRLNDSLANNESYFFAEVKRLKQITEALENEKCFVLLDEILRGTNSDDKRNGTLQVIEKLIAKQAMGIIATHDLEVCKITQKYPKTLQNNYFEVEIVNDELYFDYKLRKGICQNKSATFLMKKMGVI